MLRPGLAALLAMAIFSHPAAGQDVRWELIDSGVLDHSRHGKGIKMRVRPVPTPPGLFSPDFDADQLAALIAGLCGHYAPYVIPFVKENTGLTSPEFVAVRLVSGGVFGKFILEAFAIEGETCGGALDR